MNLKGLCGLRATPGGAPRIGAYRDLLVTSLRGSPPPFLFSVYLTDQGLPFIGQSRKTDIPSDINLDATLLVRDLYWICTFCF